MVGACIPNSGNPAAVHPLLFAEVQRQVCTLKKRQRCSQHFSGVHIVSSNDHNTVFGRPPSPPHDVVVRPSSAPPPPMARPLPPMLPCNITQQTVCTGPDLHHISQSVTSAHHQSLPPTRTRSSYSRCKKAVGVVMSKMSSPARSMHAACKSRSAAQV